MLGGPSLSYGHPFLGIFLMARSTEARPIPETMKPADAERERIFDAFRRWGYLAADLDPLGFFRPQSHPELALTGAVAELARRYYCGTIGAEFMYLPDPARRRWIAERIETTPPEPDREAILERLIRADLFEQVLQARYLGTKRFSLEGNTALIPMLDEILEGAERVGATEAILAMSHRGRLNIMTHIVNKSAADVFAGFEDVDPRSVLGGGDVKYHVGATGEYRTPSGGTLGIHLVSNPSHLEAVDPVAVGRARAKQARQGADGPRHVLPIELHGDAAFAGQGIWAETLNFADLPAYTVGGAAHIIVNNLIGFTTPPAELHSSRFASDLAKRQAIPIFHVNAEDPDAVVRVARLAIEYRYTFASDVVVDLIGYRRHGHSEVDDPTITQPLLYRKIKDHPPLWQSYAKKIQADATATVAAVRAEFEAAQKKASAMDKNPVLRELPAYWSAYKWGRYDAAYEVDTGVSREELLETTAALTRYPQGFAIHPKVAKLLEQRAEMGRGARPVAYGMAEALAFGTLLPHGQAGHVPEHSSARIARYLQLAAEDNSQVCQPSAAAQYFHLLRRQALRPWRKPLVVFTPKSMLRHPDAASPIEEFTRPRFLTVIPEMEIENAGRILICSGKIGHELRRERKQRKDTSSAIVFLEQFYPFPKDALVAAISAHPSAREIVWVQEEPANMGGLFYVVPRLDRIAGGLPVRSVKRSASASPATGSAKAHELEQKTLLTLAFTTGKS